MIDINKKKSPFLVSLKNKFLNLLHHSPEYSHFLLTKN